MDTLQWTDVLDVAVVTFILFGLISWVRRSTSSNMVIACIGFGGLYLVARALDLYLTRSLLQAILAVAVIAIVIVFQDDIRRALDRVGAWPWTRQSRAPLEADAAVIDILVGTAEHLAASRVGALIALHGDESWARAVRGGIHLDATVSQPLLESIFDHHSAGHDGAVLIEQGRLAKFAAHLPLSSNHEAIGRHGTRHAAALGLSEACDALVVIVSEETGGMSVAERGTLIQVDSGSVLRERLGLFHDQRRGGPKPGRGGTRLWRSAPLQNGALALAVAIGLWFGFARKTDAAVRTVTAAIELRGLNPSLAVDQTSADEAKLTLEGPTRAFDLLNKSDLVVVVDLGAVTTGVNVIELTRNQVDLPRDFSLTRVEPPSIRVFVKAAPPKGDD